MTVSSFEFLMADRYTRENLKRALSNPHLMKRELMRPPNKLWKSIHNFQFQIQNREPINVVHEDWDNLIILDACRYDILNELDYFDSGVEKVLSVGGHSKEFLQKTFADGEFHDTVYVSANNYVNDFPQDKFFTIKTVFSYELSPKNVVETVKETFSRYPNKKYIIHFMKPHTPYIGETAEEIRERYANSDYLRDYAFRGIATSEDSITEDAPRRIDPNIFFDGPLDVETLRACYKENLEMVLPHVDTLINQLGGKTVVTADHGELLGETKGPFFKRYHGHPHDIKTKECYYVPWVEIETGTRRNINSDPPLGFNPIDENKQKDQLRLLGYIK